MTAKARLALAASVLVVIAAGIYIVRARSLRPVRISGRALSPGGTPLSGVRITLEVSPGDSEDEAAVERVETETDPEGNFSINFRGHWRQASYRLVAQKPGFQKLSVENVDSVKSALTLRFIQAP